MEFLLIAVAECMFLIGWKANPILHQPVGGIKKPPEN